MLTQETNEDDFGGIPSTKISMELSVDQLAKMFDSRLSSTNIIPPQLCYGSSCPPIASPLTNRIQLGMMGMENYDGGKRNETSRKLLSRHKFKHLEMSLTPQFELKLKFFNG